MSITDAIRQDARGAIRGLWKTPGFTLAAIATLSLGIGATSAIFSVVKAVLLTPLPYDAPERRVMVWSKWVSFDKTWVSNAEVVDYRQMTRTMTDVAAWGTAQQNLTGDGEALRIGVGLVTANTFEVLGAHPLLGRVISADEDRPAAPPVVVLGHGLWQSRYGGDPEVINRTLVINDVPATIVGVMPQDFRLPTDFTVDSAEPTQLWRPLQMDLQNLARGSHGLYAAGTLAPGESAASATAELQGITRQLTEQGQYPEAMQFSAFAVSLDEEIRGEVRPAMWLLMGAVGFLLLIACVNVANLLLVRGDARLREIAVRTAVGAAPNRLVRQLFTESLVLASLGAVCGLLLAAAALRILTSVDPTSLPPLAPVRLDATVVAFTMVLSAVTTVVFGLAPALRMLRVNLVETLREGGQNATLGGRRQRFRAVLVAVEVALAVVLVTGAGLMIRSLDALGRIDLGFDADRVLTMRVGVPASRYETPEQVVGYFRDMTQRLRTLPGVEHAGVLRVLPLATTIGDWGLDVEGFEELPGRGAKGDWQVATDGAFEAMSMRLVRGRWFTPADTTTGALVAVVNETMARTYWTNEDEVVGGRIRTNAQFPWLTVVGIVADERHNGVTGLVKEKFYVPHSQWHVASGNVIRNAFVVIRASGDPLALAGPARAAIHELDANVPVSNVRTMTDVLRTALATPRLTGLLLGVFAAIALAMAAVGIYGVLAYLVTQRTQEIGLRLAIGATHVQVLAMVLRQGAALALGGVVGGLAAAIALTRVMESVLYQVAPVDPVTFVTVPVILFAVALAASYLPALGAAKVSPVIALRTP